MTRKSFWWIVAVALVVTAMNGGFGVPVWKQHSANSITVYTTNYEYFVLPTCPTDRAILEFGTLCKDTSTGKIFYRGTLEAIP